ncbi:hypothetical protein [Pedobacter sp. N23S346]
MEDGEGEMEDVEWKTINEQPPTNDEKRSTITKTKKSGIDEIPDFF